MALTKSLMPVWIFMLEVFWGGHRSTLLDVRVCHPNANSYRDLIPKQIYEKHENEKKRQYPERVIEIEQGTFTPLARKKGKEGHGKGKVKSSQELFDIKKKGKGGPRIPACMRVSVSSPKRYLNWDKFLSSNFVMLSMYGLQLTNNKILDICIPRSSIHFEHQLIQPIISYMFATRQGNRQLQT